LSPYNAIDFRDDTNALVNMYFTKDQLSGSSFKNRGKNGGNVKLEGTQSFEATFFQVPSEGGNVAGTLSDTK